MAHGIEGRPVFVDRAIVTHARRLTEDELLDLEHNTTKLRLREVARQILPSSLVDVPKHPFIAPSWRAVLETATGQQLLHDHLCPDELRATGVFRPNVLAFALARWRRMSPNEAAGHPFDRLIGLALGLQILVKAFSLNS